MTNRLTEFFMFAGFIAAAYSIVANDAIQTLGTFLSSNRHRPWWLLWLYACTILVAVLVYGWLSYGGDVSYGRLTKFPEPVGGIGWIHAVPPLFILLLTRYGIPVSTTFLVLTVFAPTNTEQILLKSATGYAVALVTGAVVYSVAAKSIEQRVLDRRGERKPPKKIWVALQWISTGFLWSQWLVQDLANLFVYMPRKMAGGLLVMTILMMLAMHAVIFRQRGGRIQQIVTSKSNTSDIRSATLVDFTYGLILCYFKEISNLPMSTTWVFLGLLAGRELAMAWTLKQRTLREAGLLAIKDAGKAGIGLAVSLLLAFGLPRVDSALNGKTAEADRRVEVRPASMVAPLGPPWVPAARVGVTRADPLAERAEPLGHN